MRTTKFFFVFFVFRVWLIGTIGLALVACGPNETILKSNSQMPAPTEIGSTPDDPVENEVKAMQTADFSFIFALRRKDGGVMDADDKAAIRTLTRDTNRRSLSADGKAVIVGSNYRIPAETMNALSGRFDLQDFSKPESELNSVANSLNSGAPR